MAELTELFQARYWIREGHKKGREHDKEMGEGVGEKREGMKKRGRQSFSLSYELM